MGLNLNNIGTTYHRECPTGDVDQEQLNNISDEGRDPRRPYHTIFAIFLISRTIAVLTDPLLLYIPTLNKDKKCLKMDKNLKVVSLLLRSITDVFCILHIIFQLFIGFRDKANEDVNDKGFLKYALARMRAIRWSYIITDVLAVLPIPQVSNYYEIVLDIFFKYLLYISLLLALI